MKNRHPWRDTSEDIAGQTPSQWETPAGAQEKADQAEQNAKDYTDSHSQEGAEVNQNAYSTVNGIKATSKTDSIEFEAGVGIIITPIPTEKKVRVTAGGTAIPGIHGMEHVGHGADPIPIATDKDSGLMSPDHIVQLADLPHIFQSVASPTNADGVDGDIWIKYIDAAPIAVDSVNVTGISTAGATIKAVKAAVPTYWDPDDTTATITFDVYIDASNTPYGNYTWSQISTGITISGQSWAVGTTHTIKIKTKSVSGSKIDYSAAVVSSAFGTLAQPTVLAITPYNGQITLSWGAIAGATGYNVKRSTANGGPYTTVASGIVGTSYTDSTVANGTPYYYVVSAVNVGFESANSGQVDATPRTIRARWLQFEFLDSFSGSGAYMELLELEVNSPDILPSAPSSWTASSVFAAGMEADKLADGILTDSGRWVSGSDKITNQFVKVNLGTEQDIAKWRAYTSSNAASNAKTTRVYTSTLATPSAKAVGVSNADWTLVSSESIAPVAGGGWTPYANV